MSHLHGKRILLTQSNDCMGPALCKELATHGADVIADARFPIEPHDPEEILQDTDDEWRTIFELIVDPLPRFLKAVVPGMNASGGGITSASGAGLITAKPWESDG